jgi:two-component system CheB/CheR fusion protein
VVPPEREGFGFSLVKGEVEYHLGGTAETIFDPGGLRVQIVVPLAWEG